MLGKLGLTTDMAILIICCVILVLLVLYIVILSSHLKMKRRYKEFMKGENGSNLEKVILDHLQEIDSLKSTTEELSKTLTAAVKHAKFSFQKTSLLKYDAFKEMGGKLSFSLCMMDGNNDGFLLTSMHSSREGNYTYIKEIIKGESFVLLSEEERTVLDEAKAKAQ